MYIYIECLIMGIITCIACMISCKLIYYDNKLMNDFSFKNLLINKKYKKVRIIMITSFFIGALVHYLIRKMNLTDMYCKKVCYGNKCYMVCPIH